MNSHSEQANTQKPGVHRWYDQDIHLSELVRTMELLSEESQILFALLLASFCDEVVRLKGRSFFKEMDWNKLKGLYKSKTGRRWYDDQTVLHVAFNKLYSLTDEDKAGIARKLHVPVRLVGNYEAYCKEHQRPLDLDEIQAILSTIFKDGPEKALQIYSVFE